MTASRKFTNAERGLLNTLYEMAGKRPFTARGGIQYLNSKKGSIRNVPTTFKLVRLLKRDPRFKEVGNGLYVKIPEDEVQPDPVQIFVSSKEMAQIMCQRMPGKYAMVSIRTPGKPKIRLTPDDKRMGITHHDFYDVEEDWEKMGYPCISDIQAINIADFIKESIEDGAVTVLCQCEAGISRSSAVAAALAQHLYMDNQKYFDKYHPNPVVYRRLLQALEALGSITTH